MRSKSVKSVDAEKGCGRTQARPRYALIQMQVQVSRFGFGFIMVNNFVPAVVWLNWEKTASSDN